MYPWLSTCLLQGVNQNHSAKVTNSGPVLSVFLSVPPSLSLLTSTLLVFLPRRLDDAGGCLPLITVRLSETISDCFCGRCVPVSTAASRSARRCKAALPRFLSSHCHFGISRCLSEIDLGTVHSPTLARSLHGGL